jgi:ubiquinone biosynthesis O-methyltransferase
MSGMIILTTRLFRRGGKRVASSMSTTAATARAGDNRSSSSSSRRTTGEVAKFEGMSADWWDPRRNPLISMNVLRSKFIEDCVRSDSSSLVSNHIPSRETPSRNALDVGCGGGLLSESLARMGLFHRVVGIDPSAGQIEVALRHADATLYDHVRNRLEYKPCLVEEVDELFDVVCCLEVIEHVPDPKSFVALACQRLKPGGHLFVSTINRTYKSYVIAILGAEYVMRILPAGTHDWKCFVSPQEVKYMLPSNVTEIKVAGMLLNPSPLSILRGNWQWNLDASDTDVNWIGCYRKDPNADY